MIGVLLLSGCSGGGDSSDTTTATSSSLSGVAQKGPFVQGAKVTVYKLSQDYNLTETKVVSTILDAQGHYEVSVPWSGPSKIVVEGKYLDEITAQESNDSMTLSSYFEAISGVPVVANINILTDLASTKIFKLLQESNTTIEDAKKVANQDLDEMFGLAAANGLDVDVLNITELQGATANVNAELLRLSAGLLKADDPKDSLEKLKVVYRDNNVSEVKKSLLFQELQVHREDVNLTQIAQNLEINTSNIANIHLVEVQTGTVYDDINTSVNFKSNQTIGTNFTQDKNISVINNPAFGSASSILVGNEIWNLTYVHSSCSLATDSFLYSTGSGVGRVNVSINEPTPMQAVDLNLSVINQNSIANYTIMSSTTDINLSISQVASHGSATIELKNGNYVLNYTPEASYVGSDAVVYTLTQTISGCPFTTTGNINISVNDKTFTYDDINISVPIKGTYSFGINATQAQTISFTTLPTNGTARSYLVGNELWYIEYSETSCGASTDSFVYETENGYGRVNVTIVAPTTVSGVNQSNTLFNTEVITAKYLMPKSSNVDINITSSTSGGAFSFTIIGNEDITYNYDPDDSFVGNDFLEYTLSQTINECPYFDTGRIDFTVNEYVAQTKVISTCRDPYTIGTEPYITEGTLESTVLLKDLRPGTSSGKAVSTGFTLFDEYKKIGDIQYFVAYHSAGGVLAYELYETNGTADGTFVHDINTHNELSGTYLNGSSHPGSFSRIDDNLFFIASDSTFDRYGMYKANGTTVERIVDNVTKSPIKLNGEYYYFASVDDNNVTLNKFSTDFSSSTVMSSFLKEVSGRDTKILTTINDKILYTEYIDSSLSYALYAKTVTGESVKLTEYELTHFDYESVNGKMYMLARLHGDNATASILETDGTPQGTSVIYTFDGRINVMAALNGKLYFQGGKSVNNNNVYELDVNLYELDLSSGNVSFIADIAYGNSDAIALHSGMDGMSVVNGKLIYESVNLETINAETIAYELLWASDGTAQGTIAILRRDRTGSYNQAADLQDMFLLNGEYYFQDNLGSLYKTDFTQSGTRLVLDYICDIIPDAISFVDVVDVEPSTYQEANITVEGITYPETKLSIEGGEYSLDNGVSWHTEATTIANGQLVKVRHMSAATPGTSVDTTLYVGGRDDTFTSTTLVP